jgi:hypothetical protein
MATETNPAISTLVDGNTDWFELQVLAACCRNLGFYNRVKSTICISDKEWEERNDFSIPSHNLIYKAASRYRMMMAGQQGGEEVSLPFLQITLQAMGAAGDALPVVVQDALNWLPTLAAQDIAGLLPILEQGVGYWITKKRLFKVTTQTTANPGWSPIELVNQVSQAVQAGQMTGAVEYTHFFGEGRLADDPNVERIPSGIVKLDKAMGGGFGMGEFTLAIGATGAGKTVLTSQLASSMTVSGFPGIWITTEEGHKQLEPRVYSNICNIPYDQLKDGIKLDRLSADKAAAVKSLDALIGRSLVIADWRDDRSKTITLDLAEEVRKFRAKAGKNPRWLIFDWIGGSMGALTPQQMLVMRQLMLQAADSLSDLAVKENMAVIGLAQGNPDKCKNNARIDTTCIAECHTLGRKATTILGISQLQEQVDAMASGEPPYTRKQFIYASKTRRGIGGLIPVKRAFEFQRFDNLDAGDK